MRYLLLPLLLGLVACGTELSIRESDFGQSATFRALSAEDQARAERVAALCDAEALAAFQDLLDQPARLASRSRAGRTLLQELDALGTQRLHRELAPHGHDAAELVSSAVKDVAQPERWVVQMNFRTCAATSAQYALVVAQPAEYVRLVAGLVGTRGKVRMAGGGELGLQREHLDLSSDWRTPSSAFFQGAAMEAGNGLLVYDAAADTHSLGDFSGLLGSMQASLMSQLFGVPYECRGTLWSTLGESDWEALRALQADAVERPVLLSYRMLDNDDLFNLHAVTLVSVEPDEVRYRNPWGPSGQRVGATNSAGTVVDPARGIYALGRATFLRRAIWRVFPKDTRPAAAPSPERPPEPPQPQPERTPEPP